MPTPDLEKLQGDLWGLTPLQETVDNYLFRGLDGDSLLAVDCVRRMLRSRSGQSDRLEDDDAGAGDPLPLSRGEGAPHHGQTVKSRQAADFSRKRSANLKARNRAAAPRTWSGACFREVDGSFQKGTGPFQDRFRLL